MTIKYHDDLITATKSYMVSNRKVLSSPRIWKVINRVKGMKHLKKIVIEKKNSLLLFTLMITTTVFLLYTVKPLTIYFVQDMIIVCKIFGAFDT